MTNNKILAVAACLGLSLGVQTSWADFALNWAKGPDNIRYGGSNLPFASCNRPGEVDINCTVQSGQVGISDPDKTPFLQERVVGTDGNVYYHLIIGLPTSDFGQEIYIRANSGVRWAPSFIIDADGRAGAAGSSSGGTVTFQAPTNIFSSSQLFLNQKPLDADESISGNSTGNPNRVVMRQIVKGTDFSQEFLKDTLLGKPEITQTISNADMTMQFVANMRSLTYNDTTTAAPMVNTLSLTGGGGFDIATAPNKGVTAGQYRWVPGTGPDQTGGTYVYVEGGYDPTTENWKAFRDPNQNLIKNP